MTHPTDIIDATLAVTGVTPGEFRGRGRNRLVVLARWTVAYLCRRMTSASYPEIAEAMGRPAHSTAIAAERRMREEIAAGALVVRKRVVGARSDYWPGCEAWEDVRVADLVGRARCAVRNESEAAA